MRSRWLVLVALVACGRIDFDDHGSADASAVVPAPSCRDLAAICGPNQELSCCTSPVVPGGTFLRAYDGIDYTNAGFPATVSTLRLDSYEVNVGRFRAFVDAGMGTQASPPPGGAGARALNGSTGQGGWDPTWTAKLPPSTAALRTALACSAKYQTWTSAPGGNESRPINCVDWYVAFAFCTWDGGFLPTEAEWNYAASGGNEQRAWPWSTPPTSLVLDPSRASYAPTFDTDCVGDGQSGCALEDIVEVGSLPAGNGRWGQADLGGNLYEWTLDGYEDVMPVPCVDCARMTSSLDLRAFKGGAFRYASAGMRNGYRNAWTADDRSGFRCARAP